MWFNPSELSIKKTLPLANPANYEAENINTTLQISKLAELAVPNNHTSVICYTPNGKAIEVEASSPEHAAFLIRMNPKPIKEIIQ